MYLRTNEGKDVDLETINITDYKRLTFIYWLKTFNIIYCLQLSFNFMAWFSSVKQYILRPQLIILQQPLLKRTIFLILPWIGSLGANWIYYRSHISLKDFSRQYKNTVTGTEFLRGIEYIIPWV